MSTKHSIYLPIGSDQFELCHPVREKDFETIRLKISGVSQAENWSPIEVRLIQEECGVELLRSSSPWLNSHALIFRSETSQLLDKTLSVFGELLPVICANADLFVYNTTTVLDALDEATSDVVRFDTGRLMMIKKYAFRSNIISGVDLFKIPNLRVSPTFVSKNFVDRWNDCGFVGLDFNKIWEEQ